ncbi:hypothetical protein G9A89_016817 [Geosiphon pyriformis]|nr:hypothetical protein G9A89_016817 [Geosiphon pyriformis]
MEETVSEAKSPRGKRSYTYDTLMRLNNVENCLIDTRKSRDTIMNNIEHLLKKENNKLCLEREKNSNLSRLKRYQEDIAKQQKELDEERLRLNQLRENLQLRRKSLEDARLRCHEENEYLEESQKKLERDREALSVNSSRLTTRQRELIADLLSIYPIEPANTDAFSFKILGLPLPNSVFNGDDEQVATALGFTCHLIQMLAYYLEIPLRFPIIPMSSRSTIRDPISSSILAPRQEYISPYVAYMAPFLGLLNLILMGLCKGEGERYVSNNQLGALFPLYSKGVDRMRFEYAVFLLNKNIEQLMHFQELPVMDLRHTLPNLKFLILSLISTSSSQASHFRKIIPRNSTVTSGSNKNNTNNNRSGIASSSSNSLHIPNHLTDIGPSSLISAYHPQLLYRDINPPSRSSSRSSTRSVDTNGSFKKSSLSPIAIPRGAENHRRRNTGLEVGVT